MSNQKIDAKKIIALKEAGWRTERIAVEMKMEPCDVDKAVHKFVDREGKDTKEKTEAKEQKSEISLSREALTVITKEAAEIAARTALETIEREKKKMHSMAVERRLHNTKC